LKTKTPAKQFFEDIGKVRRIVMEPAAQVAETLFTEAVIAGALFRILADTVGFVDLLSLLLGAILLVHIGVILAREFTERGFDLIAVRIPRDAKDFVVIAVAHNYWQVESF